jgi:hypothetical protein
MAGMMIRTGGSDPGSATLRKTSALIQRSAWLSTLAASAGATLRELTAHKAPFLSNNRIWIGGYSLFQTDMSHYNSLLTSEGVAHSTETPQLMAHRWDSGWVPIAPAALRQDSINLSSTPAARSGLTRASLATPADRL